MATSRRAPLLATLALGLAACAGPSPEKTTIGVAYDEPGLALSVTTENVGLAPAVGRALAADLGATGRSEVGFAHQPERSRAAAVAGHTVLFALGTDDVPASRAHEVTAVGPYLVSGLQLAVPRSRSGAAPADLAGRRVCVVGGSAAELRLAQAVPGAQPLPRRALPTCLSEVALGSADAVLADGVALRGYTAGPAYAGLTVLAPLLTRDEHSVLVPADRPDLCRQLTASLRRFVASGRWERAVRGDLVTPGILAQVPPAPVVHGCD